jgi:hypothetical protein
MVWLLVLGLTALMTPAVQAHDAGVGSLDVSTLTIGAPATIADLSKVKGDPDQLAWSADGAQFYVEAIEGNGKATHYVIAAADGAVAKVDARPAWAEQYWKFKSDRYAPGIESLVIDVQQKFEQEKYGTGSAGTNREAGGTTGDNSYGMGVGNVSRAAQSSTQNVVRLVLVGETIGTWVNKTPTPGTTFGWGPSGSGALAYVNEKGQLALLDNHSHKRPIDGTKEVLLPAWSMDGSRLAYLYKAGRNKYMLAWSTVTRP